MRLLLGRVMEPAPLAPGGPAVYSRGTRMELWQRAVEDVSTAFEQRVAKGEATRDRASLVRYIDAEWRPKFDQIAEAVAPRTDDDLVHAIILHLGL